MKIVHDIKVILPKLLIKFLGLGQKLCMILKYFFQNSYKFMSKLENCEIFFVS
jgi:hypothetical protein